MSSKEDKFKASALLGFGILLISLGVDLCKDGEYPTGIILVVLGLGVIVVYYVFVEKVQLLMLTKFAGAIEP